MSNDLLEDVLDKINHVENVDKRTLSKCISEHQAIMQELIAKGQIAACLMNHSAIAVTSLLLGQISWVMHGNLQQAREYFATPLSVELEPNFGALAKMVDEGMRGLRPWDGQKMSLLQQLEHLLCYLLLNRTAEIAQEYASFKQEDLYHAPDLQSWGVIFALHLIKASQGHYEEINLDDYTKTKIKKSAFLYEAHTALIALAQGDEAKFAQEMAACCEAFKKRKKSRLLASTWGYGIASHFCFDVVGTALYRLAVQRGLNFPQPEQRYYPVEFWQQ